MPSTASSTYQNSIEGKLITAVGTGTTTGITFKIKDINGVTPTAPTAAFRLHVTQRTATNNKHEIWGVAAGTTQSGSTVTLGTVTRALPLDDGTDFTGSGTAQSFAAGADVFLAWDAHDAAQSAKLDIANTFTGVNTFGTGGAVRFSGTDTSGLRLKSLTTSERDALTPANGDLIYNSTTGVVNQYIAGAWAEVETSATSNASNTVAGKVDIATAAEVAAGTATDATSGAINVIPVSIVKPTSTGAVSGSVPALNTSALLDGSLGGTGVASPVLGALLVGGGAGAAMTPIGPGTNGQVPVSNGTTIAMGSAPQTVKCVFMSAADSTTLTNPTSITSFSTHTYNIPANDLVAGVAYSFEATISVTHGTSGTFVAGIGIDGSEFIDSTFSAATGTESIVLRGTIMGTASAGASVAVRGSILAGKGTGANQKSHAFYETANFATNSELTLTFMVFFGTSDGGNNTTCRMSKIERISTTAA